MNYNHFFQERLAKLKEEGNYRFFADVSRQAGEFPKARLHQDNVEKCITVWCSNDYLGMGQNPAVIQAMNRALAECGAGAGGTRNISGTNHYHVLLEQKLAEWNRKEAALIFGSGYTANHTTLLTIASQLPDCMIFSDELNHNSMIAGIRHSRRTCQIFRHNDPDHLDQLLSDSDSDGAKLVAFESVYSMDGDIAPISEICDVAKKHGALTYLDEVHAVGMYGSSGAGIAERDAQQQRVDIIQGTLAKAIGVVGGYIAASAPLIDFVRSFGAGFIFSTSMPPVIAAGALASIEWIQEHPEWRNQMQERAATLKLRLSHAGLPVMPSVSHIVPLLVGDARRCKEASDLLLEHFNIYIQPINYPTVPRGSERLRITATPLHSDLLMDELVEALCAVWKQLELPTKPMRISQPLRPVKDTKPELTRIAA